MRVWTRFMWLCMEFITHPIVVVVFFVFVAEYVKLQERNKEK
jgi:hypothetical protein